jgi:hypothetical protein
MKRRVILILAAIIIIAVPTISLPYIARHFFLKEIGELGFSGVVETTQVRIGRVILSKVAIKRQDMSVKASKIEVLFDYTLKPTLILVSGAKVEKESGKESPEKHRRESGREVKIEIRDSELIYKTSKAYIVATLRDMSIQNGIMEINADASITTKYGKASIYGLQAKNIGKNKQTTVKAKEAQIDLSSIPEKEMGDARSDRKIETGVAINVLLSIDKVTATIKSTKIQSTGTVFRLEHEGGLTSLKVRADEIDSDILSARNVESELLMDKEKPKNLGLTIKADSLSTENGRVSPGEFVTNKVKSDLYLEIVEDRWFKLTTSSVSIGSTVIDISGEISPSLFKISAEMREQECQALIESMPSEIIPKLAHDTKMKGRVAWRISVDVDLPSRKKPKVSMWLKNQCIILAVPEPLSVAKLKRPFEREVYTPDGKKKTVMGGPGTEGWVPLTQVSRFIPLAIRTTEDPGFPYHRGFLIEAFERSLEQNIIAGRFLRGGSTVTMQLAKNLWLARDKTLSRKIQEAILTTYLEQHLTKDEIMELYVNVVEFGPDIYGIGKASEHYFSKTPASLTLSQSLFLSSVLPRPKGIQFSPDTKLPKQRMEFIHSMMKLMLERNYIDQEQYDIAIKETPTFGEPSAESINELDIPKTEQGISPSEWR